MEWIISKSWAQSITLGEPNRGSNPKIPIPRFQACTAVQRASYGRRTNRRQPLPRPRFRWSHFTVSSRIPPFSRKIGRPDFPQEPHQRMKTCVGQVPLRLEKQGRPNSRSLESGA